jgi:hypothetical protein
MPLSTIRSVSRATSLRASIAVLMSCSIFWRSDMG